MLGFVRQKHWISTMHNRLSYILIIFFLLNYISEVRSASPTGQPSNQPTRQPTAQVRVLSISRLTLIPVITTIPNTSLPNTRANDYTTNSPLDLFVTFVTTSNAQLSLPILLLFILPSCCKKLTNTFSWTLYITSHHDNQ